MRFLGYLSGLPGLDKTPRPGNRPRELTSSFVDLLPPFAPVFTDPTYQTVVAIGAGRVLSRRHRFVTEVIFSGGHVGNGPRSRSHRSFRQAARDSDTFSMDLAEPVVTILAPGAALFRAVDDPLCRQRGLTLHGAGLHYDPLISSRSPAPVSRGHDRVVLGLIVVHPFRAPTKVLALPLAARRYRNRQGLTQGKKSPGKATKAKTARAKAQTDPNPRTRPESALELIPLVARWFPDDEIILLGDGAYGGQSLLSHLPPKVHLISRVAPDAALSEPAPPKIKGTKGPARKKGNRLPGLAEGVPDPKRPRTQLEFDRFGLHATSAVKTMQALYYPAGRDRLPTIVSARDLEGKRPDQRFSCTELDRAVQQIPSASGCRRAIECTFEYCKQFPGLEDPANRLRKAVERTAPPASFIDTIVVVWFHRTGRQFLQFPERPRCPRKAEPSFADRLTTPRRPSYDEETEGGLPKPSPLKTWIARLTELLSRTG